MLLNKSFPNLQKTGYTLTSPITPTYNCIAWAAGNQAKWWWPDEQDQYYWPDGVPREETLQAFIQAYSTIGYLVCDDPSLIEGVEKISIYVLLGLVTHASRQLPDGMWTSKLGEYVDLSHTFYGLDGSVYGSVAQIMERKK